MALLRSLCQSLPVYSRSVNFVVRVPDDTPQGEQVFLSGGCWLLGKWDARGLPLKQTDKHVWERRVFLPADQALEFKATRGSWDRVERHPDGSDTGNHIIDLKKDQRDAVLHTVESWSDQA